MMRCRIRELVEVAREHGNASASNGRWTAWHIDSATFPDSVLVKHFETYMIRVSKYDLAYPIDEGWRSKTDKQGINQILRYIGSNETYDTLFPRGTYMHEKPEPTPKPEPVEVFVPPIRSQDTVGIG